VHGSTYIPGMNTDDFRIPLRAMRDAYCATMANLTELRRYLAER
jgi:hypothetical protein